MLTYNIDDSVIAFSTQRTDSGVSIGSYASMNINPFCGDTSDAVNTNLQLLASSLNIPVDHIVLPHQVHKTEVRVIDQSYLKSSVEERNRFLESVDAVVTALQGVCIGVSTADCVPILIYDPVKRVSAAIHAGWRGTCDRIAEKTLVLMLREYRCNPSDLKAVIGPSISLESFEVGDEVYEQFEAKGFLMPQITTRINNRWHIDLWEANRLQLTNLDLAPSNIHISGICTYINHQDFFSARRLTINSGRIYTAILMK